MVYTFPRVMVFKVAGSPQGQPFIYTPTRLIEELLHQGADSLASKSTAVSMRRV